MNLLSRRNFLKLGALSLGTFTLAGWRSAPLEALAEGLAVTQQFPPPQDESDYPLEIIGRITRHSISVFAKPDDKSETVGYRFLNDLVNIYYEVEGTKVYNNPRWYRIWGGYIHCAYVQRVKFRFNQPLSDVPEVGRLVEVSVPYTQLHQYRRDKGWEPKNLLYYGTTHWAVGIDQGPDGQPWYRLHDELLEEEYHVPAAHLRPFHDDELNPITPDLPWEAKRIEISLTRQTLVAYENDQAVLTTRISSGIPDGGSTPNGISTNTPSGQFNVESKMPSKHMGNGQLTGAPDATTLPGVPWTCFFKIPPGYALHGTYWHNNFGTRMSHGCVNLRNEDALWLFRWTHPKVFFPIQDRSQWETRGYGTRVIIN